MQVLIAPDCNTVIPERRAFERSRDLEALTVYVTLAQAVYLGLAALHLIGNPLAVGGGIADAVPLWVWIVALAEVGLWQLYGTTRHSRCHICRSTKCGLILWTIMTVAVMMPGTPIMMWIFGPAITLCYARIYVVTCLHGNGC